MLPREAATQPSVPTNLVSSPPVFSENSTPLAYLPVTLLSVVDTAEGRLKFLVAEGESVPGPILEIGNTNSRYRFPIGARRFVNDWNAQGPAHHCAVGIGHIATKIDKLGKLLKMETARIC